MNFLDSHDVARFLSYCNGDKRKLELALFYLLMGVGIPSVFYGDEYYIEGQTESEYRQAMPWGQKENCYGLLREYINIRKEHSAIRNGSYRTILCDDEKNVYVFARENTEESVLVFVNNSEEEFAYYIDQDEILIPAMSGKVYPR